MSTSTDNNAVQMYSLAPLFESLKCALLQFVVISLTSPWSILKGYDLGAILYSCRIDI